MANVTNIEIRAQDKTTTAFRKVNAGLSKLDGKLKTTGGSLGLLNGGMAKMAGLMGGVVGVAAITNYAKNLLTVGDRLQKVSLQLGISVEKLQAYQFAASQSGVDTETLNKALNKFNIEIGEAAVKSPDATTAFTDLGISIFDTNGELKESPKLLEEAADKISEMQTPAEKAAAAIGLFGQKAGVEMLPLLLDGAQGIRDYEQTLVDAGAVISQDAADDISTFNDKIDLLSRTFQATFVPVLVAVLPALTLLAENFDNIAKFIGIAASAFIVAKIPAFIAAITAGVTGLTIAIAANPIGAIAVAITALGTAAFLYGQEISEFFGFAEPASNDAEKLNKAIKKTVPTVESLAKVEKERTKISKDFSKTTKKQLIPSLKKLEQGMGKTKIQFKSLQGKEGLGGIQLAFRNFFMNVLADATFYLGGTSATIKTNFSNMKQDFEEFFKALDNIVIFEGNDVKNAFSAVMRNLEEQINGITYEFNTTVAVPANIFTFVAKSILVPAGAFDTSAVSGSQDKLDDLVRQINNYDVQIGSKSRKAFSAYYPGQISGAMNQHPVWADDPNHNQSGLKFTGYNFLEQDIPYVYGGRESSKGISSNRSSPASVNASSGGGGNNIIVNVYDGTGQKISEYDSSIRVQITERASRNSQFAALV